MTLWILVPAGSLVPRIVFGSRRLPIFNFHVLASSVDVTLIKMACCLSGTASGRMCRLDCFPTVARSAATLVLCLEVCLRPAGGLARLDLRLGCDGPGYLLTEFGRVFAFVFGCKLPTIVGGAPAYAPGFVLPFLVVTRFPQTLKFLGVCNEGCLFGSLAAPHARMEVDFLGLGAIEEGLHLRHFPDD